MTKCKDCNKSWTGKKMEHCTQCHETFNNSRAGDKHRVIDYKYAVVRWPNGTVDKIKQDFFNKQQYKQLGVQVLSENNQARRCLSYDEMQGLGMRQEQKNMSWNNGGTWTPNIYKA